MNDIHLVDEIRGRTLGEQGRKPSRGEVLAGQVQVARHCLEALGDDVGRQRARPARVGGCQRQRSRDLRVPSIELEGERATEGQPHDVWATQAESIDELSEAIGVVGHEKVVGRIR